MRIATMILGLVLSVPFFLQALLGYVLSNATNNEKTSQAGAVGVGAAFLMFIGGAFALGLPRVAMVVFAIAGLLALVGVGDYPDLALWAGAAFVLALMSYVGYRGKRRADRKAAIERDAQMERAVAAGMAAAQQGQTLSAGGQMVSGDS